MFTFPGFKVRTSLSVLLLLATFFLVNSCSKTKGTPITLQGNVVDSTGAAPIKGITVLLQSCSGGSGDSWSTCTGHKYTIGSASTDASGHFVIHGIQSQLDYYWVSANNWGFDFEGVPFKTLPAVYQMP
jgi:hypothetical protein